MLIRHRAGSGVLSLRHPAVLPAVRATESSPSRHPSAVIVMGKSEQLGGRTASPRHRSLRHAAHQRKSTV